MTSERELYVGLRLTGAVVPVGLLRVSDVQGVMVGRFGYGRSYLARPDAFPLDPINLPLGSTEVTARITDNHYPFGVFADAGPDLWGRFAISSLTEEPTELETGDFLKRGSGQGVGALCFADSPAELGGPSAPPKGMEELPATLQALAALHDRRPLTDAERRLVDGGLSLGGAHPKTAVRVAGREWIAKLSPTSYPRDKSREELACSLMAEDVGIRVMPQAILPGPDGTTLLSLRFDRDEAGTPVHFLSARSLFGMSDAMLGTSPRTSYLELAHLITRLSIEPDQDRRELFLRMVFNIAIANGDDHPRNHGLLRVGEHYRLSPAFDLTTHLAKGRVHLQAMSVGPRGAAADFNNALAGAGAFGLGEDAARAIVARVVAVVSERDWYYRRAGLVQADREALSGRVALRLGERDQAENAPVRVAAAPASPTGTWSGVVGAAGPRSWVLTHAGLPVSEHCTALLKEPVKIGQAVQVDYQPDGAAAVTDLTPGRRPRSIHSDP